MFTVAPRCTKHFSSLQWHPRLAPKVDWRKEFPGARLNSVDALGMGGGTVNLAASFGGSRGTYSVHVQRRIRRNNNKDR